MLRSKRELVEEFIQWMCRTYQEDPRYFINKCNKRKKKSLKGKDKFNNASAGSGSALQEDIFTEIHFIRDLFRKFPIIFQNGILTFNFPKTFIILVPVETFLFTELLYIQQFSVIFPKKCVLLNVIYFTSLFATGVG